VVANAKLAYEKEFIYIAHIALNATGPWSRQLWSLYH